MSARVEPVGRLTAQQRNELFALFSMHFADVSCAAFERDLAEKEWLALLTDATGTIRGFTSLMRLTTTVDEAPVVAFFSGDTIVDRSCWGETALGRVWLRHLFDLAALESDRRVFWFLISSGYRTYRLLPAIFQRFYPSHASATPPEMSRVLDAFASLKFPDGYDRERGIIRLSNPTPLRMGVADITPERLRDPDVAFFVAANPGHKDGDELACLAEISEANLTAVGQRLLGVRGTQ